MNAGKITAKLRDAVPVHFIENETERIQYRNIDIPDSLKGLEITNFKFDITPEEKISFQLFFAPGILPVDFPPIREKMTRAEKAATKAAKAEESTEETASPEEPVAEIETTEEPASVDEATEETASVDEPAAETEAVEEPASPEYRFNVTGDRRKALVKAISEYLDQPSKYLAAPSYAYAIGEYRIDRTGTLTGESNAELLAALAEQGFTTDESVAA
jgi:hypothetical protein